MSEINYIVRNVLKTRLILWLEQNISAQDVLVARLDHSLLLRVCLSALRVNQRGTLNALENDRCAAAGHVEDRTSTGVILLRLVQKYA